MDTNTKETWIVLGVLIFGLVSWWFGLHQGARDIAWINDLDQVDEYSANGTNR